MHDGGRRVREAYIAQRRVLQSGYHPDARSEKMWDAIADFAAENHCDLELYVEAAFHYSPSGRFPWVNALKSMSALTWYRQHIHAKMVNDQAGAQEYLGGGDPDVKLGCYRDDWKDYERYVQQMISKFQMHEILLDDTIPFAPWFRIAYASRVEKIDPVTQNQLQLLRDRYLALAKYEVQRDPILQNLLKEKGFDVDLLFG